jgi:hypothetical protein
LEVRVKKHVALGAGVAAFGAAAVLGTGVATSAPDPSSYNVVGLPYNRALKILASQGILGVFGGSVGSALPQSLCLVSDQRIIPNSGKVTLILDCTEKAKAELKDMGPESGGPVQNAGPHVGTDGTTTVVPTPVGPQPGMNVG